MIDDKKKLEDFLPEKNSSFYKDFNICENFERIHEEDIIKEIKKVMDPEIPVNLYDLGLIYKIDINNKNNVKIDMTLTNPNCPVAGIMPKNVGEAISEIKFLSSVKVNLVWSPKWSKNMMSEDAKLALDIF